MVKEPNSYSQAIKYKNWCKAMENELKALEENKTWEIVELLQRKKAIGNKWVYKAKFNSDETLERYKARLIAKGYNQIKGIDYTDTFAPVSRMTTLRILIALAATQNKWHLHQMNVQNTF